MMYINATGTYVPDGRVDNAHFLATAGLDDEWILKRTGIRSRARADRAAGEGCVSMALAAVSDAIAKGVPYDVTDVDLVVSASYTPVDTLSTLAHEVQRRFGIDGARALHVSTGCSSFVNGLEVVESYFASGKSRRALLVTSEHNSYYSNDQDVTNGHLWGDAAVAYFLSADPEDAHRAEPRITTIYTRGLGNIGHGPDGIRLKPREGGILMPDGRDIFVNSCHYLTEALQKALEQVGLKLSDLDYVVPHQANMRIIRNVVRRLGIAAEKVLTNIVTLGNTGAASAALVLAQSWPLMRPGMHVGVTVFGGGYSCGAFIVDI